MRKKRYYVLEGVRSLKKPSEEPALSLPKGSLSVQFMGRFIVSCPLSPSILFVTFRRITKNHFSHTLLESVEKIEMVFVVTTSVVPFRPVFPSMSD